ncbi:MAG: hypothetical protein M3Y87_02460 [Myxococcota bacterium]|nr:hypothetical protein [Myxococcota bacterium]
MSLRTLLITALVLSGTSAIAVAAGAQAGSAVQSLAGPRTLRVVSLRHNEHVCGMSSGSADADLTLSLSIDRAGAAMLSIEGNSRSLIASHVPSRGGVSVTGHAVRGVARGSAAVGSDGRLIVRFVDIDVATAYWSGPGTAPVGPSTTQPFAQVLSCSIESTALLPAGAPRPDEVAASTTLAHCVWEGGVPSELTGYSDGDTWLGEGSGVEERRERSFFDVGPTVTLRAR